MKFVKAETESSPCCRCGNDEHKWDKICGRTYCHFCLESLAVGEADPIFEKIEERRCVVCGHTGTVKFLTYPQDSRPIEMNLCALHLRAIVGRCLVQFAFNRLREELERLNIDASRVFLLHEVFYDPKGLARCPAIEDDDE